MHIGHRLALLAILGTSVAKVAADEPKEPKEPPPAGPVCLETSHEARYKGMGYDHVVIVNNTCSDAYRCAISTNVNPRVVQLDVPPKSRREVVTFRGSPARQFVPNTVCTLRKK